MYTYIMKGEYRWQERGAKLHDAFFLSSCYFYLHECVLNAVRKKKQHTNTHGALALKITHNVESKTKITELMVKQPR